ncbi:MAG: MCE family protein [Acidobacteria bacterium]|nr:MCE family protein [Acidobacteriota bacterium]
MPASKKVAWAQLKVGVVALVALIIMATLIFLITGSQGFFRDSVKLYTYLSDSQGLTNGVEVRVNGILAGKVNKVELAPGADPARFVTVEIQVFEDFLKNIPEDSIATITSDNVLGSKFINIKKGKRPVQIKAGAELKSLEPRAFEAVVESGNRLLVELESMLKRVDNIIGVVERGEGSIGKLIYDDQLYANLNGTASESRKLVAQLNSGKGSISKLLYDDALVGDIQKMLARVDRVVENLEQGQGTMGKLLKDTTLHDDLRKLLNEFRQIAADLNAGKGSAGKLLKDDALVKKIDGTIARVDKLLDGVSQGKGTLGQLVVNQQLYDTLNGTMREMNGFMKDFRANPKKFLSIKLGLF